jgi:hypothetical protein
VRSHQPIAFLARNTLPPAVEADKKMMEQSRHSAGICLQEFSQTANHPPNHSKPEQTDQVNYRRSVPAFSFDMVD